MKHFPTLFTFLLLLVVCSCHRRSRVDARLDVLDSLVSERPDSVLRVLDEMSDSIAGQDESVRMHHALLTVKAQDKSFITHTDDSLIMAVVRYYDGHRDDCLTPEAWYYAGRVHADMGDAPQALDDYQKALDHCTGTTKDVLHIRSLTYSQLGTLYTMQLMYEDALDSYQAAYKFDEIAKDTLGLIYDLRDIASTFSLLKEYTKADSTYALAEKILEVYKDEKSLSRVYVAKASLYARIGRCEEALRYAFLGLPQINPLYRGGVYHTIAEAYHRLEKLDSAALFYERAFREGNVYARESAAKGLAEIALTRQEYTKASEWYDIYVQKGDSARSLLQADLLGKMQHVYNYQLREKEANRLQKEVRRKRHFIIMLVVLLTLIVLVSYILHIQYKHYKLKQQMRYKQLKGQKEALYKRSKEFINSNRAKIAQLEGQLAESAKDNAEYRHQLELKREELLALNVYIQKLQEHETFLENQVEQSDVFRLVQNRCNEGKPLGQNEWDMVELFINELYPDYMSKLREWTWMTDVEKQVCLLMKLDITSSNIAVAICKEKSSVSQLKRRLYKKANGVDAGAQVWDEFIASL